MATSRLEHTQVEPARVSRTDLLPMIRGTVAALRCRELATSGAVSEARVELSLLRSAIQELADRQLEQLGQDLEILRAREKSLAALLSAPPHEPSSRQRTPRENVGRDFRFMVPRASIDVGGPLRMRNDTPAENVPAESSAPLQPASRRQPSSRTNAMLIVSRGQGEEQIRLLDFLRDYADDADVFEQVGALKVGQVVEIVGGGAPPIAVRRIQ